MKGIAVTSHISIEDLLRGIEQLDAQEFDQMIAVLLRLRASRRSTSLSEPESSLLLAISQSLAPDRMARYQALVSKRKAEQLEPAEQDELIRLTDEWELLTAQRMQHLIGLAAIRNIPLEQLCAELGIEAVYE
ncbi:MAG: hypothetical protein NW241_13790 [Bacteroidia bacterium]|nr:hypothetical protein [Bacteroidia bacterium]